MHATVFQSSPGPQTAMKTLFEYGVQVVLRNPPDRSIRLFGAITAKRHLSQTPTAWTCRGCLVKHYGKDWTSRHDSKLRKEQRGNFSTSVRKYRDEQKRLLDSIENANLSSGVRDSSTPPDSPDPSRLPSQTERQRWQMSKRMADIMDQLLARASTASQRINVYTGTDYSGIEALRKEIIDLEQKVRQNHRAVDDARAHHRDAHSKQTSAQKEIVGLLERKSSWSPGDLERYMSLVRAEHTDEQAVQTAKDSLKDTERTLEESRSLLERLERKQYHEEQIWSDTIRRNSTWVTFGLMGVNIVLLLAQIAVFEPYRRRKIVRDVQKALDEKTLHAPSPEFQRVVDEVVEPRGVAIEQLESASMVVNQEVSPTDSPTMDPSEAPRTEQISSEQAATIVGSTDIKSSQHIQSIGWSGWLHNRRRDFDDLFSERVVQMRKIDVTKMALQGTTAGVVAAASVFLIWQRR